MIPLQTQTNSKGPDNNEEIRAMLSQHIVCIIHEFILLIKKYVFMNVI